MGRQPAQTIPAWPAHAAGGVDGRKGGAGRGGWPVAGRGHLWPAVDGRWPDVTGRGSVVAGRGRCIGARSEAWRLSAPQR